MRIVLPSSRPLRSGHLLVALLVSACGGGSTGPTPLAYEWLPQDSTTVAAAESVFLARGGTVLPACGENWAVDCPGGAPGAPIDLDVGRVGDSIAAIDSTLWSLSARLTLKTGTDIPITVVGAECGLAIDTGAGTDSTITFSVQARFVRWEDDSTLNRIAFSNATVSGLSGEDVAITGDGICLGVTVELAVVLDVVTSALAGDGAPLCGAEGPVLFQSCPEPATASGPTAAAADLGESASGSRSSTV